MSEKTSQQDRPRPPREEAPTRRPGRPEPGPDDPVGKVEEFTSRLDGESHGYAVCATDDSPDPKPAILVVSPGGDSLQNGVTLCQEFANTLKTRGKSCVVVRPTGRGPGTLYMNYGEVDLFEALEDAIPKYHIDRDRIAVMGGSMGGAATWYLASHYPDVFAAASPSSGYCDYRLWAKPGGFTFPMQPWEEPSWIERSATFRVDNLEYTPQWILHGEWDRAVGGGVPVEHSRRMDALLSENKIAHRYTEVPKGGHSFSVAGLQESVLDWLTEQKKERAPKHVALVAHDLRHNKSYWVTIEQLQRYGGIEGLVDATVREDGSLVVKTRNIRAFSIGPVDGATKSPIVIDGQTLDAIDPVKKRSFRLGTNEKWSPSDLDLSKEKRHGCSGPIADLFFESVVLVYGTSGAEEDTRFNKMMAGNLASTYSQTNGGVHRGGIMGQNSVKFPIIADTEVDENDLAQSNLILFGNDKSNSVLTRLGDQLPITFGDKAIQLAGKTYEGEKAATFAVFPSPGNPDRYVAVFGGVTPDAITFGSHLNVGLLPDYIVYSGGQTLGWGFWGNDWGPAE